MKKLNIKTLVISSVALVLLVFFSVMAVNFFGLFSSKSKSLTSMDNDFTASSPEMPGESAGGQDEMANESISARDGEKIISTFFLDFETVTFKDDMDTLRKIVTTYEGYIEASDIYQQGSFEGRTYQYGSLTIKVPKDKANAFIEEGKKQFHLVRENSSAQNVTLHYKDTKLRLDTLTNQKDRLNELYNQAERIEDIISIESKLSEVILEIEYIKSELDYLDRSVDYATITVALNEVANLSNNPDIRATFSERISAAFKDSLRFFKEASADFAVFIVYALPFMVILAVVVSILALIFRRKGTHKKKTIVTKDIDHKKE